MAEKESLKKRVYCGEINEKYIGKHIAVQGWVQVKRELGGITFIDLRDREGILQVVVHQDFQEKAVIKEIGREYVLSVKGQVVGRTNPNPELPTGKVELIAEEVTILNPSELPPFFPENRGQTSEELRFQYRYLDLRNQKMQKNLKIRSQVNLKVRQFLSGLGFLDIETPVLSKATPEGARDYLVPSRIHKGKMFALPQSPQIFKQLLMVSGTDRYYQITKCFRDEDLRADRQPEFTQIDIEMSFSEPETLREIINDLMKEIFAAALKEDIRITRSLTYQQSLDRYGTDTPDLRIPYEIRDFSETQHHLKSSLLTAIIENQGAVKGLVLPDSQKYSRKVLDGIDRFIKELGGRGIAWIRQTDQGFKSSLKIESADIEKFYLANKIQRKNIVFLIGDSLPATHFLLGKLRVFLGKDFQDKSRFEFVWITDFPLFFFNPDEQKLDSNHHPFTSPRIEDIPKLDSVPLEVKSIAYDLVLNGVEIGGGSQRIHDIDLQKKIFKLLNLTDREIQEKFGFFLNALKFGAPPHLGIALGFDRIIMLITGEESIREVIAFPKTTSSLCLLTGSPSTVAEKQLSELGIQFKKSGRTK